MKNRKLFIIAFMLLLTVLTACGSNPKGASKSNNVTTGDSTTDSSAAENQENTLLPKPAPNASVDQLLGNWADVESPDRFVTITKSDVGDGYLFEDNEGKYKATFADGNLKVLLSMSSNEEYLSVVYDEKLENMVYVYEGMMFKYKKTE